MIPVIAQRGRSFAGAFAYYFHDKKAWSTERIAWSETVNLLTDCVEKGWKWMAYTAKHQDRLKEFSGQRMTGAKMSKPVFCYSLSWHPEQRPSKETMLKAAHDTLETLGLIVKRVNRFRKIWQKRNLGRKPWRAVGLTLRKLPSINCMGIKSGKKKWMASNSACLNLMIIWIEFSAGLQI